jgi:hypothetical protein
MSESSSDLSASASSKRSVDDLVERLRRKSLVGRLPLLAHLSIGRTLCKLRDAITNGDTVSRKAAQTLLCCGIAMYRRHAVGENLTEGGEDRADMEDREETTALVEQSAALIFVLLAAIEARTTLTTDVERVREVVERAGAETLTGVLLVVQEQRKRKVRDYSAEESPVIETGSENGSAAAEPAAEPVETSLPVTSGDLTLSLLRLVSCMIAEGSSREHERLASIFFRTSAACMAQNLLLANGANDFVSLKATVGHPVTREKRLLGIAQAGESEAGQSCLRDILLSFLLPTSIIGVRRNLLLSRAASTSAGIDYADAVNNAHSVA